METHLAVVLFAARPKCTVVFENGEPRISIVGRTSKVPNGLLALHPAIQTTSTGGIHIKGGVGWETDLETGPIDGGGSQ